MKPSERQAIRNAEMVAAGICRFCRGRLDGASKTRCSSCVEKRAKRYADRLAAGICNMCPNKTDVHGKKTCSVCAKGMRDRATEKRKERLKQGVCIQCAQNLGSSSGKYCGTCLLKTMANHLLGSADRWVDLKWLLDAQHGCCAYTGEPIEVGDGGRAGWRSAGHAASIDHILPVAKGGTNDLTNLQWVSWLVNNSKRDTLHQDFVLMCVAIAKRHGPKNETFAYPNADGLDHCVL